MKTLYTKALFAVFIAIIVYGCNKADNSSPLHKYAKNMSGAHVWKGIYQTSGTASPGHSGDTTYSISYSYSFYVWDTMKYDYVSAVISRQFYSTDRYSSNLMNVHTP